MFRSLLFTLSLLVFVSCQKADLYNEVEEPTEANLTVSIFQLEQTPFPGTRSDFTGICTHINFAIYDSEDTKVKQTNQIDGDDEFGTASFQLPEGRYQLVVVAHSSNGNPSMTNPAKIQFTNAQGYSDTFLYSAPITIGTDAQSLSISLNRIVSLCRFVITDNIPSEVKKLRFYYTGGSGAFDASTGLGSVNSKQDVKFDVTSGQKQFDLYTILHDEEGTIHLQVTALDAAENIYSEREFDVPLTRNQITWLTGTFFNGGSPHDTKVRIDIDTSWDGEQRLTY